MQCDDSCPQDEPIRVFVVEDEALIAMALEKLLASWGFAACGSAARATDALREIHAAQPHVVLMDVDLGPGMSGLELARALRSATDCRFVFLTGASLADLEQDATGLHGYGCLSKPYLPDELRAAVLDVLAVKSSMP